MTTLPISQLPPGQSINTSSGTGTIDSFAIGSTTPESGAFTTLTTQGNAVATNILRQNIKSTDYTTVIGDAGYEIYHPLSDNNARTFTIDSNADVPYPVGTQITFTNAAPANLSIAITDDTMTLAGTNSTGTRTLFQNGTATAAKKTATTWIIAGAGIAPPTALITLWDTTKAGSAAKTIVIPAISTGIYNGVVIDYGDGIISTPIYTYNDPQWTHVYAADGVYRVTMYGALTGLVFNNGGDCLKLTNISQWGSDFIPGSTEGKYFRGCANLTITASDNLNLTGVSNFQNAFGGCAVLTTIPSANTWITSSFTSLDSTFADCPLFNQNINGWDVHNVTTLANTFVNCVAFNQSLNSWVTTSLTNLSATFQGCTIFNGDISSWDVSHVTLMNFTFNGCTAFNSDITEWNTGAVVTFAFCFSAAITFNQNIGAWNTGNATSIASIFSGATSFNQNIGSWNVAKVTNFSSIFSGATSFDQNIGSWVVTAGTNFSAFLASVTLSKTNYNALLAGWGAQSVNTGRTFSGGNSHYDATTGGFNGTAGRLILTSTRTWTITDGGTP